MVQSSTPPSPIDLSTSLAECGWRVQAVARSDGTLVETKIPLAESEFLHPQEGYHLPNSTFHDDTAGEAKNILTRRYANSSDVGVFRDLLIEWDINLGDHCPDTFVAVGIHNKYQNRSKFIVADEGVRPLFILEVVSPRYRKIDRETKVVQYAKARVQEYVIIDRRTYRQQVLDEVLGYRLVEGFYQPITPDDEGRIQCDTLGISIGLQDGRLVIEDAQTGQRLKTALELEAENRDLEAENRDLEAENRDLEAEKNVAQAQAAEMAALLTRYQEQFGVLDLSENGT
jgi:Uma2 family endonuclease